MVVTLLSIPTAVSSLGNGNVPLVCCSQRFTGGVLFQRAAAVFIRRAARSVAQGSSPGRLGTPPAPSTAVYLGRAAAAPLSSLAASRAQPLPRGRAAAPRAEPLPAQEPAARPRRPYRLRRGPRSPGRPESGAPGPAAACPSAPWAGLHRAAPGLNGDEKRS